MGHTLEFVQITCNAAEIAAARLDQGVWSVVCDLLLRPEICIEYLDSTLLDDHIVSVNHQIDFMERQFLEFAEDESKLMARGSSSATTLDNS